MSKIIPGQIISHYKILEKLGAGGMGEVFKARDTRLDRLVALKFLMSQGLNEEKVQRFILEAQTTSALDHPNICTIYEIDETPDGAMFIAMAYYEGQTLRQKLNEGLLSVQEATDICTQLLEGLKIAHENGIIHRDIKPANIILRPDGILKILDFGIAKLQHGSHITRPGLIIGTPVYMAPEQFTGEAIDHRIDLWATGVIFYEMLTGRLPFTGDNELSLMYGIVNETPPPLQELREGIDPNLELIIQKALAKDKKERYASAEAFLQDLKILSNENTPTGEETRVSILPIQSTPSIAVLPFEDVNPSQEEAYFCDGLTEEIINALSKVEGLRVISRNSVFQFKGKHLDPGMIARKLKVKHLLEGSVRKGGDKIRISVQLVKTQDAFLIWSETFDRQLTDVFAIQDEISQTIVRKIAPKLIAEQTASGMEERTEKLEAYNSYLKGRFHLNKRTAFAIQKSVEFFEEATKIDPSYALPYAGLADAYTVLGIYGTAAPDEVMPRARENALKALEMNPHLAEAHTSLGCIRSVYEWSWEEAEASFREALRLNPTYSLAHHWYSINHLTPLGRFEEALAEMLKALTLDPISLVINASLGLIYYFAGKFDTAFSHYRNALELDPDYPVTHLFMGEVLVQLNDYEKAIYHLQKALQGFGDSSNLLALNAYAHGLAGDTKAAQSILDQLLGRAAERYISAYDIATVYIGLGDLKNAKKWLQKALEEKSYLLIYAKVDPILSPLQKTSVYKDILKNIFKSK